MSSRDTALTAWVDLAAHPVRNAPALFLDRDGTIIEDIPYLGDPGAVTLIPGVAATIAAFRTAGFAVVVVTNQSGVGRGLISPAQYRAVAAAVLEQLGPGLVDATYACPSLPDGSGAYGDTHCWRKPGGGMLRAAAAALQLDLAASVMVGDSVTALVAAADAGVGHAVHVLTGHGVRDRPAVTAWAGDAASDAPGLRVHLAISAAELVPQEFGK